MVRKYERKTARASTPPDIMLKAVRDVKLNNLSMRQVAEKFSINYRTLTRYCKKIPEEELLCENITTPTIPVGYVKVRQTFTNSQEQELINYIQYASNICLGFSAKEVRILAYNLAQYNSIKMPISWIKNKMAGDDWFNALMKRHNDLPVQKTEIISKARETSFNRTNVELFYKNLKKVMSCYHFQPEDIWNMDEIGITTLQVSDRIVARRNHKQIENISTAHGHLVTMACTISAKGDYMPPFFVFPRVYFRDYFIESAPVGSSGTANKLGWMEETDFDKFLRHFHAYAKCSIEKPVLLLLDQQRLHLSIESLNYTKENGIVMLFFPQYCSYKLQPLDRTVFESLREHINSASTTWILNNPNHMMNIYNVPEVVAAAYPLAMTSTNIQASFKYTGIFPYNNDIFSDLDFEPNFITIKSPLEENIIVKNNDEEQAIKEDMIKVETDSFHSSECDISESFPEKSNKAFKISSDEEKEKVEDLHSSPDGPRRSPRKYAKRQVVAVLTDIRAKRKLVLQNIENKNKNKRKSIKILLKETDKETKDNSDKKSKEIKHVIKCKKIARKTKVLRKKKNVFI